MDFEQEDRQIVNYYTWPPPPPPPPYSFNLFSIIRVNEYSHLEIHDTRGCDDCNIGHTPEGSRASILWATGYLVSGSGLHCLIRVETRT